MRLARAAGAIINGLLARACLDPPRRIDAPSPRRPAFLPIVCGRSFFAKRPDQKIAAIDRPRESTGLLVFESATIVNLEVGILGINHVYSVSL